MSNIIPVAIAVIHKEDKFLLTERKGAVWHFPGGAVEFREDLEVALRREIREELAIEISIETQLPHVYSEVRAQWHGILIPYLCCIPENSLITLNNESLQYQWFSLEEIKKMHTLLFVVKMAEEAHKLITKE